MRGGFAEFVADIAGDLFEFIVGGAQVYLLPVEGELTLVDGVFLIIGGEHVGNVPQVVVGLALRVRFHGREALLGLQVFLAVVALVFGAFLVRRGEHAAHAGVHRLQVIAHIGQFQHIAIGGEHIAGKSLIAVEQRIGVEDDAGRQDKADREHDRDNGDAPLALLCSRHGFHRFCAYSLGETPKVF